MPPKTSARTSARSATTKPGASRLGRPKSTAATPAKPKSTWGGPRPNSGRKPGPNPAVAHRARATHDPRHPLLVTLPRAKGMPSLRSAQLLRIVRQAIVETAEAELEGFRIVFFAIAPAEVELLLEADDRPSLTTGLRSVSVRMAMRINNALDRRGQIFRERYRARPLPTPEALKDALATLGAHRETAQPARTALLRKA